MEEKYTEKLEYLKRAIENSNYMVCLMGVGVSEDCGCINFRKQQDALSMEIAYGYSPEEMFNPTFFSTRTEQFYDFYKNYMRFTEAYMKISVLTAAGNIPLSTYRKVKAFQNVKAAVP